MKDTLKMNKTQILFHHAYEVMMKLKNGEIQIEEAKAQANLLEQANNIMRFELDRAIAVQKYNFDVTNPEGAI